MLALLLNRYRKGSNVLQARALRAAARARRARRPDLAVRDELRLRAHQPDAHARSASTRLNIFGSGTLALLTIVLAEVWRGLGFWTLYFLASLQNIPEELLDAARVDGAKGLQRFRRVTIPLLRPMLLFAVVIAIIANFQVFDTVYVLTQGGPARVDLDARVVHLEAAVPVPGDGPGLRGRGPPARDHPRPDGGLVLAPRGAAKAGRLMARTARSVEDAGDPTAARRLLAGRPPQPDRSASARGSAPTSSSPSSRSSRSGRSSTCSRRRSGRATSSSATRRQWIPHSLYTGNFGTILHETSYLRWGLNTLIFATCVTADHAGHRHAGRLRVRAAPLPGQDGALRARADDADDPDGRGRRAALHHDLAPPRLDAQRGQYLPGHDPADGRQPARRLHDAPVHLDAAGGADRGGPARRRVRVADLPARSCCR